MRLVYLAHVREKLREATDARVTEPALLAAVDELERAFDALLKRVAKRYEREREAAIIQGLYPRRLLREDHIREGSRNSQVPPTPGERGSDQRAAREVNNEEDAPEVA